MHIVLVEPEIPQNTGSIARTCAATDTELHLVGKLGFEISEKRVRRAGLDYWPHVKLKRHASFDEYLAQEKPQQLWFFTKFAERVYYQANFDQSAALVFGSETRGLGKDFLAKCSPATLLRIPINTEHVRSLNLSNAVSIALFEARRQLGL